MALYKTETPFTEQETSYLLELLTDHADVLTKMWVDKRYSDEDETIREKKATLQTMLKGRSIEGTTTIANIITDYQIADIITAGEQLLTNLENHSAMGIPVDDNGPALLDFENDQARKDYLAAMRMRLVSFSEERFTVGTKTYDGKPNENVGYKTLKGETINTYLMLTGIIPPSIRQVHQIIEEYRTITGSYTRAIMGEQPGKPIRRITLPAPSSRR